MSTIAPAYTANGLGSTLNDSVIIQSLVSIRQAPISQLASEQNTLQTQVSELGSLASDLNALQQASDALATGGVVASTVTSSNTAFTATAGTGATPGQYSVQVTSIATSAKARSAAFTNGGSAVTGGTVSLGVQGTAYSVTVTDGEKLADVAQAINQLGAPISANILSDGTHSYLELINTQTGFPVSGTPSDGLSVSESDTGSQGQSLGLAVFQPPTNSALTVDGLSIKQSSNTISNVIPGMTLKLTATESAPESLVVATDAVATAANLKTFVNAYNTLNAALQTQLNPPATPDSTGKISEAPAPLSSDSAVLSIEQRMQQIVTTTVPGLSGLNSLASIGISTSSKDGSMSIDSTLLDNALSTNPSAVNLLFSQATTGVSAAFDALASTFADPASGALIQESGQLTSRISQMTAQQTEMKAQLSAYQASLQSQFANMEQLVANFKSVGNYLTQLSGVQTASNNGG